MPGKHHPLYLEELHKILEGRVTPPLLGKPNAVDGVLAFDVLVYAEALFSRRMNLYRVTLAITVCLLVASFVYVVGLGQLIQTHTGAETQLLETSQ